MVRTAIVRWSKDQQRNSKLLINKWKEEIEHAMTSPTNDEVLLNRINSDLRAAYLAEESLWKQRSRNDDWLSSTAVKRPMGLIPEAELNLKVAELLSPDTKEWDMQRVERSFPLLLDNILSIKTSRWGERISKFGYDTILEPIPLRQGIIPY